MNPDAFARMMAGMSSGDSIVFGGGTLHESLLPTEEIRAILEEYTEADHLHQLSYSPARGTAEMLDAHRTYLRDFRGIDASAKECCIVNGGTQGIDLLFQAILDPGDTVLVEQPTFLTVYPMLRKLGVRCIGVRHGENGIDIDDLDDKAAEFGAKLLYCIPTFQNPSGAVMSPENRRAVYETAHRRNVFILEDDPYHDLDFKGIRYPSIRSMDTDGRVALVSSYSKIIAPGLRIGAVTASAAVIDAVVGAKQCCDMHASGISQHICAQMVSKGLLLPHLKKTRLALKERAERLTCGITDYFPLGSMLDTPRGGIFSWVRLPMAVAGEKQWIEEEGRRITYMPGAAFFIRSGFERFVRLNYAGPSIDEIDEGIKTLGAFFSKIARHLE